MNKSTLKNIILALTAAFGLFTANCVDAAKPIMLEIQGSYAIGGSTVQHDGTFSTKNFLAASSDLSRFYQRIFFTH